MNPHDEFLEVKAILEKVRPILQTNHDEAEQRHDTYGGTYGSEADWEIIQTTERLMQDIDEILTKSNG